MTVARLNMCHGNHEWHRGVIERIRRLNLENGWAGNRLPALLSLLFMTWFTRGSCLQNLHDASTSSDLQPILIHACAAAWSNLGVWMRRGRLVLSQT
jgi:hypothetical protein